MNKAKLKTYAPQARKDFIAAVTARANLLGIAEQNGQLEITPGEKTGDLVLIAGQAWPAKVHNQRERLIQRMRKEGFAQTIEAVAYTWFNRFAALRFMEIHDYLGHGHRVLSSREGGLPEILTHATELAGVLPGLNAQQIADMKLAGNKDGELYRLLLVAQCNALSNAMPFLFERIDDESELLLPGNLERTDSVVAKLVEAIPEEDWNEVEVIGWLYQFYISEKKDEVIGKVVKSEDIPAATQLFTPNWIVQYLVQNSIGRLWLMANPTSNLKSQWPYYIEPAEQTPEVQAQLDALVRARCAEGVDSGGDDGGTGLSRIDRLAEGDGSCRGGVSADTTVSQRRVVQSDKSSAAGSRVDSIEHRRGASSQIDGGVSELSVDSPGVKVGGGNAASDCNSAQVCNDSRHADGAFLAAGITENAVVPANPSRVNPTDYPLSTIHYPLDPESITVLDPACGSGHILVEAYEVLKGIYLERGYRLRDIPRLILEKNLYGLDIDDRAAQLAGFALLMKARADDRRLLETPVKLNVLSLQESAGMDLDGFASHLKPHGVNRTVLGSLLDIFTHAKTFGSLIQIPKLLEDGLAGLEDGMAKAIENGDVFAKAAAQDLVPLVQQAKILAMKFDSVVANPPYMGQKSMTTEVRQFALNHYAEGKSDLFSMFVIRCGKFSDHWGRIGLMTPFVWMFLGSYESIRKKLTCESALTSLVQPQYHTFFESAAVPICAFVIDNSGLESNGNYFDLTAVYGAEIQHVRLLAAIQSIDTTYRFQVDCHEFEKIPSTPIAYWTTKKMRDAVHESKLVGDFGVTKQGLITGNNNQFLRLWHEVSRQKIGSSVRTRTEAVSSGKKWFPCVKGGAFRKWFGNNDFVVDWESDGKGIRSYVDHRGKLLSRPQNLEYYFREGMSWSTLTIGTFSMRWTPAGSIFESKGSMCFPNDPNHGMYFLAFFNTKLVNAFLRASSPTLDYHEGPVARLAFRLNELDLITGLAKEAVAISKSDWDSYEGSQEFSIHPLCEAAQRNDAMNLAWGNWKSKSDGLVHRLKVIEEKINSIFINTYGLQDELSPEVPEDQITLTRADREKDSQRLISYAIGCMMGRYSLDEPGLIYAHAGNVGFDATRYKKFPADADGIIPITDELWFEDDAANRIREFLLAVWPEESVVSGQWLVTSEEEALASEKLATSHSSLATKPATSHSPLATKPATSHSSLATNMQWLAESLGTKGNETPAETIRRYLASSFFKDHLQTYKKRPIYWLFSSGKQGAFQALVYLHRYHEGTLARMRAEYVVPLTGKMQSRIEMLEKDKDAASSTAARNKIAKQIESLKKKHVELLAYDEKLRHYADRRISLDLDDGVKVNYGKFGELLAEVKAVTGGAADD